MANFGDSYKNYHYSPLAESTMEDLDLQKLVKMVLTMPIESDKDAIKIGDRRALMDFKGENTDVITRILLQLATESMRGSPKHIQILFDYGGMKPEKEHKVQIDVPVIIDDMRSPMIEAATAVITEEDYTEEEESEESFEEESDE